MRQSGATAVGAAPRRDLTTSNSPTTCIEDCTWLWGNALIVVEVVERRVTTGGSLSHCRSARVSRGTCYAKAGRVEVRDEGWTPSEGETWWTRRRRLARARRGLSSTPHLGAKGGQATSAITHASPMADEDAWDGTILASIRLPDARLAGGRLTAAWVDMGWWSREPPTCSGPQGVSDERPIAHLQT